jgi:hypothetical protein
MDIKTNTTPIELMPLRISENVSGDWSQMVVQPHFTVPVNIRAKDRPLIEAALEIAQRENKLLTSIFREALAEYVERRKPGEGSLKLEQYFDSQPLSSSAASMEKVLIPSELRKWSDPDLLCFARKIRARASELELELKKRHIFFRW